MSDMIYNEDAPNPTIQSTLVHYGIGQDLAENGQCDSANEERREAETHSMQTKNIYTHDSKNRNQHNVPE